MSSVAVGGFVSRSMAELSRTYLAEHGIAAEVRADDAGGAAPHISHAAGGVHLIVAEEDASQARELLEQPTADTTEQHERSSARWVNRVGRWALAGLLVAFVTGMVLSLLTGN